MTRLKHFFALFSIPVLMLSSCVNRQQKTHVNELDFNLDSTTVHLKYADVIFTIPSPSQTLFLLKNINLEYNPQLLSLSSKSDKYLTTFKKALILGIWGADFNYLNLYNQKEAALHYLQSIKSILADLELDKPFEDNFFKNIEDNFGNNDSVCKYLSYAFKNCDEYLKLNDKQDIGALIIAGGWIESFYLLTQLYASNYNLKIFDVILYQKEIADNLIKMLSKYYNNSEEYTELIDDLVNLAYEYDIVDTQNSLESIYTDSIHKITFIKNKTEYIISGSQPDKLIKMALTLRNKHILND